MPAVFPNLPQLHSLAGAPSAIFLDFDGNLGEHATPVYDTDHDPSTLSAKEVSAIRTAWSIVAEDYAPFNVDVTTVQPTDGQYQQWVHVCIGGSSTDWIRPPAGGLGGVPYSGNSTDSHPAYVFQESGPIWIGDTISHEAGHSFGLTHQASYAKSGRLISDYNKGNGNWQPIMGLAAGRYTTWYNGPTPAGPRVFQDDMAIRASALGYRPDDYGDTIQDATPLPKGQKSVLHGLIGTNTDVDVFSLHHPGGLLKINLAPAKYPNLDAVLILRNSKGKVIATSHPKNSFAASLTKTLPPGQYFISVKNNRLYGSVGQYTLSLHSPPRNRHPSIVHRACRP